MNKYSFLVLLFFCQPIYASSNITLDDVNSWRNPEVIQKFNHYSFDDRRHINLTDKEDAYLISATMKNAGRNSMFRVAMVIPKKKMVLLLQEDIVTDVERVLDLDNNGTSEIVVKSSYSGQGSESGTRAIIQINADGSINQLHKFDFENNNSFDGSSYSHDVEWSFVDHNNDKAKDLEEKVITSKSVGYAKPTVTSEKHIYIFKNSRFTEE